jgi:hypothetical protein
MKALRSWISFIIVIALLAAPLPLMAQRAQAAPVYTCLPSCSTVDGRFMSIAGYKLSTMANTHVNVEFVVEPDAQSIEIGIFDGNTSLMWDEGSTASEYVLYLDPEMSGATAVEVDSWLGTDMPDNAWFIATIPTNEAARGDSDHFYYHLEIRSVAEAPNYWNNFKVRSDGLSIVMPRVFAFTAGLHTEAELPIIYPSYPTSFDLPTYDGSFKFRIYAPGSLTNFTIWDGDMDYGSFDQVTHDTDDIDTPNDVRPPWTAYEITALEGVAVGTSAGVTGLPADDVKSIACRRSPSVNYEVILPDGRTYQNANPSGNMEWEQFRIETDPQAPEGSYDYFEAEILPPGLYTVRLLGMDMHNLNTWRFPFLALGECEDGEICKELEFPFLIGDSVFYDLNGNGLQDPGEPGIQGVVLNLFDSNDVQMVGQDGLPLVVVTDADGKYSFDVRSRTVDSVSGELLADGIYTVQVAPENFAAGGALAGLFSSTGGEEITDTVDGASVWSYDFGYSGVGEIGDLVWLDSDGDGIFDEAAGELPLANVAVSLNGGAPVFTSAAGIYLFQSVLPGAQTISVDPASLPIGLVPTYDYDGAGTPHTASLTLMPLQSVLTVDFGYQPPTSPGTGTIGYWKNHPEAWPVASIKIGGVIYPRDEAIRIMSTATKTDKTYGLFAQLVAAKLNLGIGNQSSCIEAAILAADAWLMVNPVGSGVKSSSAAWKSIESSFALLDAYNNGLLCAPHRD